MEVAALLASYAKIHGATKIRILFLYWDSPEEENRHSRKTSLNA
jgi:FPC/CPF motif-containing protein YcgG